jgi:hypothetical protein
LLRVGRKDADGEKRRPFGYFERGDLLDGASTLKKRGEGPFSRKKEGEKKEGFVFSVSPLAPLPFLCCLILNDGPLFFCACLAALLHELGHVVAIYLSGGRVRKFAIHPFGAEIVTGQELLTYGQSLFVALAGVGVNALCALPLLFLGGPYLVQVFSACSLALALFNLLPLSKLDGGEALFHLGSLLVGPQKAFFLCRICSFLGIFGLFCFLLLGVFFARFNPLFLLLFVYLLWGVL